MAFRSQDLMADVLPDAIRWASCPGGTTCAGGGAFFMAGTKGIEKPPCHPASCGTSPKPNPQPRPGGHPPETYTDLALLRRQLRQTLSANL
ncbi:MAG TPA: hypothetical protein VHC97_19375 [Thermoanaerobaculia bacterium]|jgi:hypothetical protein|nr:hypothetical protein [Thermoanaerobaculia bacterium]